MSKTICCVNDMPGVGKIALSAMIPILSAKGISVACLPTALVSNTLDFGKFEILDTSDYMHQCIQVWCQLGFQFDCISTGFMVNPRQVALVEELIAAQPKKPLIVVDPIMGDNGKLYNGIDERRVTIMRQLSAHADVLLPNYTEACYLCDVDYDERMNVQQSQVLIEKCRALGAKSVVITSAKVDGRDCVIGYDHHQDRIFMEEFEWVDVRFPGTGDIFSAVLIGDMLNQVELHQAVKHAMRCVRELILSNLEKEDKFMGVDIEAFIEAGCL